MDYNKPLDQLHAAEETVWVKKVNTARVDGRICSWASAFHPEKLPCRLDGGFLNGSYNVGQRIVFDDGAVWFLRLPRASSISPEYANERSPWRSKPSSSYVRRQRYLFPRSMLGALQKITCLVQVLLF